MTTEETPIERAIVQCSGCRKPAIGYHDEGGVLRIGGSTACPYCGNTELREITAEDVPDRLQRAKGEA